MWVGIKFHKCCFFVNYRISLPGRLGGGGGGGGGGT